MECNEIKIIYPSGYIIVRLKELFYPMPKLKYDIDRGNYPCKQINTMTRVKKIFKLLTNYSYMPGNDAAIKSAIDWCNSELEFWKGAPVVKPAEVKDRDKYLKWLSDAIEILKEG